jgi:hypothetical protein
MHPGKIDLVSPSPHFTSLVPRATSTYGTMAEDDETRGKRRQKPNFKKSCGTQTILKKKKQCHERVSGIDLQRAPSLAVDTNLNEMIQRTVV